MSSVVTLVSRLASLVESVLPLTTPKISLFKLEVAPLVMSFVLVVTLFMSRATLFEPIVTVSVPSDLLFKLVVTLAKPIPAISEPVEILSEPLPALFEPVVRLSRLLASGDLSVFVDAIA